MAVTDAPSVAAAEMAMKSSGKWSQARCVAEALGRKSTCRLSMAEFCRQEGVLEAGSLLSSGRFRR